MASALFYQFTDQPPEALLPALLRKVLGQGHRVVLRGPGLPRMEALESFLWEGEGFLPHGLAGGAHDALQPVLLAVGGGVAMDLAMELPNRPDILIALDGVAVAPEEVQALERVCIFFDANDAEALAVARGQWRAFRSLGVPLEYWNREGGKWARQHQHLPEAAPE